MSTAHATTSTPSTQAVTSGALGGLAGGLVFGLMMQVMGMMPMVAMLARSESVAVGWVVHLVISAVLGGGYGLLLAPRAATTGAAAALGLLWGVVWWVLGALLLMPMALSMPVFQLGTMAWQSLAGHLVYGLVTALATRALLRR